MNGNRVFAGLLFWGMSLVGGLTLIPCVVLPPWFEYHASLRQYQAEAARIATLERKLARLEKQVDHQQNDPAYAERQVQLEFGLPAPGEQFILPDAPARIVARDDVTAADAGAALPEDSPVPAIASLVDDMMQRYPLTRLFILEPIRTVLMILGGALLLAAIILLGRGAAPRLRPADEAS